MLNMCTFHFGLPGVKCTEEGDAEEVGVVVPSNGHKPSSSSAGAGPEEKGSGMAMHGFFKRT